MCGRAIKFHLCSLCQHVKPFPVLWHYRPIMSYAGEVSTLALGLVQWYPVVLWRYPQTSLSAGAGWQLAWGLPSQQGQYLPLSAVLRQCSQVSLSAAGVRSGVAWGLPGQWGQQFLTFCGALSVFPTSLYGAGVRSQAAWGLPGQWNARRSGSLMTKPMSCD